MMSTENEELDVKYAYTNEKRSIDYYNVVLPKNDNIKIIYDIQINDVQKKYVEFVILNYMCAVVNIMAVNKIIITIGMSLYKLLVIILN